jgi:hypothetical protein|nr:MAG TPA: HemX, putative uroporphyrinogen-III C-methyltransferase [Caudoviricetes sp.]
MGIENAGELLGVLVTAAGVLGWVFKVWIINPLTVSIKMLENVLGDFKNALRDIQSQAVCIQTNLASLEESLKSAHKRIDDLNNRATIIEKELREHDWKN